MREFKTYIKDGDMQAIWVEDGKAITTIEIDGRFVSNPSIEDFLADGWEEYQPPVYQPTIEELVEQKLRERYSINQEFEVQRKRNSEPQAFQTYYDYVEECIAWAKEQIVQE